VKKPYHSSKWLLICLSMLLVFIVPVVVKAASTPPTIQLNGYPFISPAGEPEPYINSDGRIMVPVRFVSSTLGVSNDVQHVKWDAQNNMASIIKGQTNIDIQVGNKNLMVNDKTIKMNTAAELKNGRVFIPLRYIAESLDAKVEWDAKTHVVYILTDPTNNFSRYSMVNISNGFPVSIKGSDSQLSIYDAYIYPYESVEAKALIDKYGLKTYSKGTEYYLVWMAVSLKSNEGKVSSSISDKVTFPFSFGFNPSDNDSIQPVEPKAEFDTINNPDVLYKWQLDQNNVVQSHIALILTYKDIERFFLKSDKEESTLAIRQ
jgi:hypothetical protein